MIKFRLFSNFLKRLKRKLSSEYEQTFKKRDGELTEEEIIEDDGSATVESSTNRYKQARINLAIAKDLIIKGNLPLNLVKNSAFRDLINAYNVKRNSALVKQLKHDTIARFKEKVNQIIYDTLNAADPVTLTVDGRSGRK